MQKIALITGITGQDGSYLAELLLEQGYTVHGIVRRASHFNRSRIEHLRNNPAVYNQTLFLHYADLQDATTLRRIFNTVKPTEFYHLAGQSHVGLSFEIPESTAEEVAMATLSLLEICRDLQESGHPVRIYHAASSEIFGAAETSPQTETTPINPTSPYGVAKAFAAHMCRVYRSSYGLYVCNGILYNHESPRRGESFVTRKITRTAAAIAAGKAKELRLGNLDAKRDWGHAKDYVRAMHLMLQQKSAEDCVIATGNLHTVKEFVALAFKHVNLNWEDYVVVDPAFFRPLEPTQLCGNPAHAHAHLGWKPEYTFEAMVAEMVQADVAALQ